MNKIKNNLPLILVSLSSILLVIAILLLVNANIFKTSNKVNSNDTSSNDVKEIEKNNKNEEQVPVESDNPVVSPTPTSTSKSINTPTPTSTPTPTATLKPTKETETVKNEQEVINYFEAQESSIKSGNDKTFREKAKEGFVTIVDFIFYDKEIKGHTFKELTNTAKLKIISIALKIDSKIDSYFPDYKDKIKGTYNNIKEKLVEKYLEYTQKLCEAVGSDTCNQAKKDWEALKKNFKITGEYLKQLGITGTDKLKTWYENFRDNN